MPARLLAGAGATNAKVIRQPDCQGGWRSQKTRAPAKPHMHIRPAPQRKEKGLMTLTSTHQKTVPNQPRVRRPYTPIIIIFCILILGNAAIYTLNALNIIKGDFASIFGAASTSIGLLIALFTWLMPMPQSNIAPNPPTDLAQELGIVPSKYKGELLVHIPPRLRNSTIYLSPGFDTTNLKPESATSATQYDIDGFQTYIARFSSINPENYTVHDKTQKFIKQITILPGRVTIIGQR